MTAERPPERPDVPTPVDAAPPADVSTTPSAASMALDGAIPGPAGSPLGATAGTGAIDTPEDPTTTGTAEHATAEPATAEPATTEPAPAEPLVPPGPADGAIVPPATVDEPVAKHSRRGAAARGTWRFIQFVIGVGLFVLGIWIGMQVFQSTQKPTDPVGATAVSNGVPTPPVVEEFAHALQTGGPDAVRSSMSTDVFGLLASELTRWDFATIKKVDVLSTAVDGPRAATGLILTGTTTDGRTMWINLIVQTENGQISTLR